ncbi:protein of unknown function [Paraburkholderia dioscoreae]|uniref:Uncharacterized protein n=1 Tax=Paraburkholderia dioscoreae TaxID=2604047 RepID=A0A5Q4YUN9_9BURK|nr:protein of unknown function [Paraburkholderia dioscoreae]
MSISLVALMIPPGCIWLVRPLWKRLLGRARLNRTNRLVSGLASIVSKGGADENRIDTQPC